MVLCWLLLQTKQSLLWEEDFCSEWKQAVASSQRSCSVVCTAGGTCLGAACPFVQVLWATKAGRRICFPKGFFPGDYWPHQPVCCVPAWRREKAITQKRLIFVAYQLQRCSYGVWGEEAICCYLAWLSCESTELFIVLKLGGRSWQCAHWAAVFSKG